MPYCKIKNTLWIHIPKTGGSSVYIYFVKKYSKEHVTLQSGRGNKIIPDNELRKISLQHQTYNTLYTYRDVLKIDFNRNIKLFAIVRNPYNRLISDLFGFGYININSTQEEVFETIKTKYLFNTHLDNHNIPQYNFICDDNGILIDKIHILKTETLNRDMADFGFNDFSILYGSTKSKGVNIDENAHA